jgi:hypothetical protein
VSFCCRDIITFPLFAGRDIFVGALLSRDSQHFLLLPDKRLTLLPMTFSALLIEWTSLKNIFCWPMEVRYSWFYEEVPPTNRRCHTKVYFQFYFIYFVVVVVVVIPRLEL